MANILIAEDDAAVRQVLAIHLELVRHTCREVENAAVARTLFDSFVPDAALLDVMMPGEDVFSLGELDITAPKIFEDTHIASSS